VTGKKDTIINY